MALFDDLLELLGLGGITGLDVVFAGMAIAGTLLFIVYFGLVLIGGVADGALDAVGIDVDFGMDSAEGSFQMLTVQGILSFVMMFGILVSPRPKPTSTTSSPSALAAWPVSSRCGSSGKCSR